MRGNTGNVRSNIMCTYSRSRASKEVSETHHMYLLMVTCNKINELTCSIRNNQLTWQYGVLFGFQPILVLGLHIQIHARAVLGCTDHVPTDHPE